MALSNGQSDQGLGPCQMMMQAGAGGLDQVVKAWDPVTRSAMRANLEVFALANRRAQAYLEIPSRMAQCRNPRDLVNEQTRFWQTAASQYQDSARQMMSMWTAAMPAFSMFGFGMERAAETMRDYITFPEPREVMSKGAAGEDKSSGNRPADRRAAA